MLYQRENILEIKVENLTNRIIKLVAYLKAKHANAKIIDQISRSGLSIGANTCEAKYAQSKKDFASKLSIALKEANETKFWIRKLHHAQVLNDIEFESIHNDADEIVAILFSIVKTLKQQAGNE